MAARQFGHRHAQWSADCTGGGARSPDAALNNHDYSLRPLLADELRQTQLDRAVLVFAAALGYRRRDQRVNSFADTIRRHAALVGFCAFGASDEHDTLVGFAYGYASQPGLWWREQIAQPLSAEQRSFWLSDAFELAELHVHPTAQGQRLGSQLHDLLLANQPHRTALLSVMHRSERARQLYTRRGWQTLVEDLRFPTEPRTPFSVLGLHLPAVQPST